jgi:hypothetical protein
MWAVPVCRGLGRCWSCLCSPLETSLTPTYESRSGALHHSTSHTGVGYGDALLIEGLHTVPDVGVE